MAVANLLVNIICTLVVVGAGYVVYLSNKNDKVKQLLNAITSLPDLASQAVIWAEKNGLGDGKEQFDKAVLKVKNDLNKIGIDDVKQDQIEDAVEHAWAILKNQGTLDLYKK